MRLACVLLALALLALALAAPAGAQRRGGRARSPSPAAQYRTRIREAVSEFDAGRWAEARALFRQAHELEPGARTLRGIGMCSFELREYGAAIGELGASLEERRRPLTSAQQRQTRELIARAHTFVGRYTIRVTPETARIRVDDAPAPAEVILDLGRHVVRVELDGYAPAERRLEVRGGEHEELVIALARAELADPTIPPRPPGTPSPLDVEPIAIGLFAAAGATLALGISGAIWAADRASETSLCDAAGPDCLNASTLHAQHDASIAVTITGFALTAALATTAAVLLLTSPSRPADHALRCAPSPLGLACTTTF